MTRHREDEGGPTRPGAEAVRGAPDGRGVRVAVAVSRFNERITRRLLAGAHEAFARCGVPESQVDVEWTPGAWELPILAQSLARTGRYDAVVCLGCVIRGETTHDRIIGLGAMTGLARVALDERVPVTLGLLTVHTMTQAEDRSGGAHGNKGEDAALAAIEMAVALRRIRGGPA
ncbi:MAG TPA: 6,7-dimethyl-8-ribityllumazine synthase [bacterium]|nr:6,7-dimethyl-8-ribityllumazine synthase [bacterium]